MLGKSTSQVASYKAFRLFSSSSVARTSLPSLTEPLPNLPSTTTVQPASAPTFTTLSNGIRVATIDLGGELASFGVYFGAGSRTETTKNSGVSHFLERVAFKSTKSQRQFKLVRELQALGSQVSVSSGRESVAYTASGLRGDVAPLFNLVADVIANPAFRPHEIDEEREIIASEVRDLASQPKSLLVEALHATAFRANTLGNPLLCPPHNVGAVDAQAIQEFVAQNFARDNVVVVGTNISHDELSNLVSAKLGSLPATAATKAAAPRYTGGEARISTGRASQLVPTHSVLAFKGCGLNCEQLYALNVLQAILGGGSNMYSGSAGSASRLATNVVAKNSNIHSANAFTTTYSDSGLFGVYIAAEPQAMGEVTQAVVAELKAAAQGVKEEEVARGRNLVKAALLQNLEKSSQVVENLALQVRATGKASAVSEELAKIDAVTAADIKKITEAVLKTNPTLVSYGDLSAVPLQEDVLAVLRS